MGARSLKIIALNRGCNRELLWATTGRWTLRKLRGLLFWCGLRGVGRLRERRHTRSSPGLDLGGEVRMLLLNLLSTHAVFVAPGAILIAADVLVKDQVAF